MGDREHWSPRNRQGSRGPGVQSRKRKAWHERDVNSRGPDTKWRRNPAATRKDTDRNLDRFHHDRYGRPDSTRTFLMCRTRGGFDAHNVRRERARMKKKKSKHQIRRFVGRPDFPLRTRLCRRSVIGLEARKWSERHPQFGRKALRFKPSTVQKKKLRHILMKQATTKAPGTVMGAK